MSYYYLSTMSKFVVNQLCQLRCYSSHAPCTETNEFKSRFTVTVLNAAHKIGRHVALLLKQNPLIKELRLYDQNDSVCVVAEDLSHIDTKTMMKSYYGLPVLKEAVTDADLVISLGGCRKKVKTCPKDLFHQNLDDVRTAALHLIEFNPKVIYGIATPPIEAMVPLVSEEFKKAGRYVPNKIIGISTIGCMRANHFVSLISAQNASEVRCPIVGGISPKCLVAAVSQARPLRIHPQHFKIIQDSVYRSEDEAMETYGDGNSICLSPAVGIARFVNTQLNALTGKTDCVDCAFVKQSPPISLFLPYMTTIVRLGRHGIVSCHMPQLTGFEGHCLKKARPFILECIELGQSFVTGGQKEVKGIKETKQVVKI